MPGAYLSAAYAALAGPVQFVTAARVVTVTGALLATLDVKGGTLTLDEEWSPYAQASLSAVDPNVVIDSRLGHRLQLDLGYVYPNGLTDAPQVANLSITSARRTVTARGVQLLEIAAQSDEALVLKSAQWALVDLVDTFGSHGAAISDCLVRALSPYVPTIAGVLTSTSASMTNYRTRIGDDWWPHIKAIADMGNGVVYCDENRTWRVGTYKTDDSPNTDGYVATADVPDSWPIALDAGLTLPIVTESELDNSRNDWANAVIIEHNWVDAATSVPQRSARIATVTTGPNAVGTVGYRVYKEQRTTPITLAENDAECASLLYRTSRRGARRTITARAAYWFRPRDLRRFYLAGTDTYARITRVAFALDGSGLMTLTTRTPQPDGAEGL